MKEILTLVLPIICTSLCGLMVWLVQKAYERPRKYDKAFRVLLRADIIQEHEKLLSRGWVTTEELGAIQEEYEIYHDLGGNGYATLLLEDIKKLERR